MELWEMCRSKIATQQVPRKNRRQWQQQLDQLQQESMELRTSLVSVRCHGVVCVCVCVKMTWMACLAHVLLLVV